MKTVLSIAFVATLSACTHGPSDTAGDIIPIPNADFEQTAVGDDIPGWMLTHHAGVVGYKATLDHDGAAHGSTSLRFEQIAPQVYGDMKQHIDLNRFSGKTVELSAMMKCANVGPQGWKLFISGNSSETLKYSPGVKETTGWQRQSVQLKLPPQVGVVTIGASLLDSGTGWLDDVQLRVVN